jgi:hypothetical protein
MDTDGVGPLLGYNLGSEYVEKLLIGLEVVEKLITLWFPLEPSVRYDFSIFFDCPGSKFP